MTEKPTLEELQGRIERDISFFEGQLTEEVSSAWYGYLAALVEWDMLSVGNHARLCELLPQMEDNPATAILLGRD